MLMAPPKTFAFLDEYSAIDPSMNVSYVPLDCRDMQPHIVNPLGEKLY